MGVRMTGAEIAAKYKKNLLGATEDIKRGVTNTDKDQAGNAIKAIPKMKTRIIEAIDNGKVAKGLTKAGHAGWQKGMLEKGVNNIAQGINVNEAKIIEQMGKVGEVGEAVRNVTKDMPNNNLEEGISKVRKAAEMQQDFWKNQ